MDMLAKLTDAAALNSLHNFPEPPVREREGRPSLDNSISLELGVWQKALFSFFNLRNHPLNDAERADISSHDFSPELGIVQQVLRRCLLLSSNCTHELSSTFFESDEADASDVSPRSGGPNSLTDLATPPLISLSRTLSELWRVSEVLRASRVDVQAWISFEQSVRQGLIRSPLINHLKRQFSAGTLRRPQPELHRLTECLAPDALAADMLSIFSQLAHVLEQLRFVETLLRQDYPLKQSLAIFTLVHEEARALIDFIEKRATRTEEIDEAVFDALDSTGYALGMELLKVFGQELVGLAASRHAPTIFTKVENAHGLLRDCFQQTTVALAQVFDSTLDGARLFHSFHAKLEYSLTLRHDLWTLLQLVLQAEKERDRRPLAPLLECLRAFREGSQRFLMYKDWESFERFVAEVTAARGAVELTPVLHRFGTYLEALFGQINMRAVLADQPFDYPGLIERT